MARVPHRRPSLACERGQAAVEALAVIPFVIVVGAVAWQLGLVGYAAWQGAHAARAAARADVVGEDAEAAARSVLPGLLQKGLEVEDGEAGGVRVVVRVPLVLPGWGSPVPISASSSLGSAP